MAYFRRIIAAIRSGTLSDIVLYRAIGLFALSLCRVFPEGFRSFPPRGRSPLLHCFPANAGKAPSDDFAPTCGALEFNSPLDERNV